MIAPSVAVLALLVSCHAPVPGGAASPCPRAGTDPDLTSCATAPASHGTTPDDPFEWGIGGMDEDRLYFGRLVCPGGGEPTARRQGNAGKVKSRSPMEPVQATPGLDVVDEWSVHCPGEADARTLYVNPYRCGDPCPPAGFSLLPAQAAADLSAARMSLDVGDATVATQKAADAVKLAPTSEAALVALGVAQLRDGKAEAAADTLGRARQVDPQSPFVAGYLADALHAAGRDADAEKTVDEALSAVPQGHPAWGELTCKKARFVGARDPEAAKPLASAACEAGAKECCGG